MVRITIRKSFFTYLLFLCRLIHLSIGFFTLLLKEQTEMLALIIITLGLALTISTVDTLVNAISSLFVVDGKATFNLNKKKLPLVDGFR